MKYRPSTEHGNADVVSRLPYSSPPLKDEDDIFFFSGLGDLPVDVKDISRESRGDPVLVRGLNYILTVWPIYVSDGQLKPYFTCKHGLTADQGCVLWGMRVIIPPTLRNSLLRELHEECPVIVAIKAITKSYIW